jgi:hypothetical protein
MDGSAAIERNRVALQRIVLSLFAMAGLTEAAAGAHPPQKGAAKSDGPTISRHLWRAVLRLLRPAESAARRLIIAAARGIVVPAPAPRRERPYHDAPVPDTNAPLLRSLGIAVTVPPAGRARTPILPRTEPVEGRARGTAEGGGGGAAPRIPAFALCDPPRNPLRKRRRMTPPHAAPRIMLPGVIEPHHLPPPPSPDDAVSAARLGRRLAALAAALDDLPGQARRFARWKARRAAEATNAGRFRRISPLRAGRPPGGRLSSWDASARDAATARAGASRGRPVREIDLILVHAHELAFDALSRPDTS